MSIMEVLMVPDGIAIATDRTLTREREALDGSRRVVAFTTGAKSFRWYQADLAIVAGYVGTARIGDQDVVEYLQRFFGRQSIYGSGAEVAEALAARMTVDHSRSGGDGAILVHFAHFEFAGGEWVPHVWFVHNTRGFVDEVRGVYRWHEEPGDPPFDFVAVDSITDNLGSKGPIRPQLEERVALGRPYWFHQGKGLGEFNTIASAYRAGLAEITVGGVLRAPSDIADWADHARAVVLAYGAFYEAFFDADQQVVGGGADVYWISWPTLAPRLP